MYILRVFAKNDWNDAHHLRELSWISVEIAAEQASIGVRSIYCLLDH